MANNGSGGGGERRKLISLPVSNLGSEHKTEVTPTLPSILVGPESMSDPVPKRGGLAP